MERHLQKVFHLRLSGRLPEEIEQREGIGWRVSISASHTGPTLPCGVRSKVEQYLK